MSDCTSPDMIDFVEQQSTYVGGIKTSLSDIFRFL